MQFARTEGDHVADAEIEQGCWVNSKLRMTGEGIAARIVLMREWWEFASKFEARTRPIDWI